MKLAFGPTLPAGVTEGSTKESLVSITDDDVPTVTVNFEQDSYTVAEGNSVAIKATLNADPERTVTIPLTKTGQGGATTADYSGLRQNVVFNSGDTENTLSFTAVNDTSDDDGESVKLTLGVLPTGVSAGTTTETTVSITDNDDPTVAVSFQHETYTVTEGSSVTMKVKLSADPERTVEIDIAETAQGNATAADYTGVPGSVSFNAGDTEQTFVLSITQDTEDDDGESVKLGFGATLPTGVTAGTPAETTVSITDDDYPAVTVSFEQASYAVGEGDNVTVKVKLSADPERTVAIPLDKTDQDGANSADYSGVPNSVTFDAGETEYEFTFTADSDNIDDEESVKLVLGTPLPSGVTAGSPSETVVSITDDDLPSVNVSFSAGSYSAEEGGTVQVMVTLSQAPARQVSIPITKTEQGGASNSDYSGVPITVNFAASDTEVTFTFSATDDSVDDDGESVNLGFGAMPLRVPAGTNSEATVNITDGDVPTVSVSFEQNGYSVAEGSDVDVKVQLDADPERDFTISILKLNQNGSDSSDYSGVPANVMFASGETEKSFTFTAESDDMDDDGENVRLSFGTMPAGVNAGTNANTTVSVVDDDHPADVKVSFENAAYTVAEGNSAAVKLTLKGRLPYRFPRPTREERPTPTTRACRHIYSSTLETPRRRSPSRPPPTMTTMTMRASGLTSERSPRA